MKRPEQADSITHYIKRKIREVLRYHDVSLTRMAHDLDMDESQLSRLLHHSKQIMSTNLLRIAQGLIKVYHVQIDLNQFINEPPQKP